MDAAGIPCRQEHALLPLLHRALPRPHVHHPRQAHRRLLQLHSRPAVRPPRPPHPRLVLAAARVARQGPSRSVYAATGRRRQGPAVRLLRPTFVGGA